MQIINKKAKGVFGTYQVCKSSLSFFDDKRYKLDNGCFLIVWLIFIKIYWKIKLRLRL